MMKRLKGKLIIAMVITTTLVLAVTAAIIKRVGSTIIDLIAFA